MVSVASHLIEEVTAHVQRDSLEDAREIFADSTYFPNNLQSFKQMMWLKTHLFSVMGTKVVIPHADLHCCFPPCFSLRLAMLVEGFSVSKSLHFCSINVINSLSVGNLLYTCFICHLWRVWLSKHSTTSCDNMMSSNSCSMFNAFSDLKLLQNVFINFLISPMSSLLIDFKPSICLT